MAPEPVQAPWPLAGFPRYVEGAEPPPGKAYGWTSPGAHDPVTLWAWWLTWPSKGYLVRKVRTPESCEDFTPGRQMRSLGLW